MTTINLDNLGNSYFNQLGFPNGIPGSGTFAAYNGTNPSPGLQAWLASVVNLYQQNAGYSNSTYIKIDTAPFENCSGLVNSPTKSRFTFTIAGTTGFGFYVSGTSNPVSNLTAKVINVSNSFGLNNTSSLFTPSDINSVFFGLKGSQSLFLLFCESKTLTEPLWTRMRWMYFGWVLDPLFTGSDREKGLIIMDGHNIENESGFQIFNIQNPSTATQLNTLGSCMNTFGYSLNCQVPKPEANVTDMILRTDTPENLAIGRVQNMVICKIPHKVGTIVELDTDPDGSTNNKWLCIYKSNDWGSVLVRVWVAGI